MSAIAHFPWLTERKARFQVGPAFYRQGSQVARDLGILAATVYRAETGHLRVLDAMAGCGIRSLRYWLESGADWVWTNDSNPDLGLLLQSNLAEAIASKHACVTHLDANRAFFECYNQQDAYDLVDVDAFGSAAPYLSTSLWAPTIGGLLYLTSTDGRTATGHLPINSLKVYGAYARSHPAAHEQGLRLLIGAVHQQAAAKGLGIEPLFSLFWGETYRVMVRLVAYSTLTGENYGFLGYCRQCGNYQSIPWHKLGRVVCSHDASPLCLTGPLWLGNLHHPSYLHQLLTLATQWEWVERIALLNVMYAEAKLPPYFYTLGEIGRRGKVDIPARSQLIQNLRQMGYQASATHLHPQAIKTNADIATCIQVAHQRSSESVSD